MKQSDKDKKRRKVVGRVVGISIGVLLVLLFAFIARVVQLTMRDGFIGVNNDDYWDFKPKFWEWFFFGTTWEMNRDKYNDSIPKEGKL